MKKKKQTVNHTVPYSTAPNNTFGKGGYAKIPKHIWGAVIGAAVSLAGNYQQKRQQDKAQEQAMKQRAGMMLTEDTGIYEDYPVSGNEEVRGLYKKGGNMKLVGYNAKGGDLLPLSNSMDLVDGNTHDESTIDGTSGVKLANPNGQVIAEVEDEEVIKDDKKVYSDRLKYNKKRTYAEEAERIGKIIGKADSILAIPNISFRKKNSALITKQNWERAADDLFNHQEEMKAKKGIKDPNMSTPLDTIPKGKDGLYINDAKKTTSEFNRIPDTGYSSDISEGDKLGFELNPYVDNIANLILTATTPKSKFPLLARQRKLKTKVNVNPQLQDVTDTVNQTTSGIERGTSNSNTVQQRSTAVRLAGMKEKGKILSSKENIETDLENRDILNKQQIEGQNLARIQGYQDKMQSRAMNIQGRLSANASNFATDINKQQQAEAIENYQNEQLDVIRQTYDTDGTVLRTDLQNEHEVSRLVNDPEYRKLRENKYLATDAEGNYVRPREAQLYLNLIKNIPQ